MGLGIYIKSEIPKIGILKRNVPSKKLFDSITDELKKNLPDISLGKLVNSTMNDDTMFLYLYPVEEPVEFSLIDNYIICSAKTNSAGPGYHAFIVESLEKLEYSLGLKWNWSGDEDYGDETNYYLNRNFDDLKLEMLKWLKSISRYLTENQKYDKLMISMPLGFSLDQNYFAISPLGFWTKDWFIEINKLDIDKLEGKGGEFFPWWEKNLESLFYLKTGLAVTWVEIPWHTYNTEYEYLIYKFVIHCFEKVSNDNHRKLIPENINYTLNSYLNSNQTAPPPEPSGIGFRKRSMHRSMTGSWTASIPGYFYFETENEDETYVYWFDDKTIRGSSFIIEGKENKLLLPNDILPEQPNNKDVIEYSKDHLLGWATIELINEIEKDHYFLNGYMSMTNQLCYITIYFENEDDKEWAIQIWKSTSSSKFDENDE
jgi:hypothetical protein